MKNTREVLLTLLNLSSTSGRNESRSNLTVGTQSLNSLSKTNESVPKILTENTLELINDNKNISNFHLFQHFEDFKIFLVNRFPISKKTSKIKKSQHNVSDTILIICFLIEAKLRNEILTFTDIVPFLKRYSNEASDFNPDDSLAKLSEAKLIIREGVNINIAPTFFTRLQQGEPEVELRLFFKMSTVNLAATIRELVNANEELQALALQQGLGGYISQRGRQINSTKQVAVPNTYLEIALPIQSSIEETDINHQSSTIVVPPQHNVDEFSSLIQQDKSFSMVNIASETSGSLSKKRRLDCLDDLLPQSPLFPIDEDKLPPEIVHKNNQTIFASSINLEQNNLNKDIDTYTLLEKLEDFVEFLNKKKFKIPKNATRNDFNCSVLIILFLVEAELRSKTLTLQDFGNFISQYNKKNPIHKFFDPLTTLGGSELLRTEGDKIHLVQGFFEKLQQRQTEVKLTLRHGNCLFNFALPVYKLVNANIELTKLALAKGFELYVSESNLNTLQSIEKSIGFSIDSLLLFNPKKLSNTTSALDNTSANLQSGSEPCMKDNPIDDEKMEDIELSETTEELSSGTVPLVSMEDYIATVKTPKKNSKKAKSAEARGKFILLQQLPEFRLEFKIENRVHIVLADLTLITLLFIEGYLRELSVNVDMCKDVLYNSVKKTRTRRLAKLKKEGILVHQSMGQYNLNEDFIKKLQNGITQISLEVAISIDFRHQLVKLINSDYQLKILAKNKGLGQYILEQEKVVNFNSYSDDILNDVLFQNINATENHIDNDILDQIATTNFLSTSQFRFYFQPQNDPSDEFKKLQEEIEELTQSNKELEERLENASGDPTNIEQQYLEDKTIEDISEDYSSAYLNL